MPAIRRQIGAANDLRMSGFTPQTVASCRRPGFSVTPPESRPPAGRDWQRIPRRPPAFRGATTDLFTSLQELPVDPPLAPALDFVALKTTLLARLDPAAHRSAPRAIAHRAVARSSSGQPPDPIEPIMAAPEFPQPMYAPLRDLSPRVRAAGRRLFRRTRWACCWRTTPSSRPTWSG